MKHFSLVKAAVALIILNTYIFSCAVTGTVKGSAEETSVIEPAEDESLQVGGTLDFIDYDNVLNTDDSLWNNGTDNVVIESLGFAKPTFMNKTAVSSYLPTSSVKELTQKSEQSTTTTSPTESEPDIIGPDIPPVSSSTESSSSSSETSEPVESSSNSSSSSSSEQSTTSSDTSGTPSPLPDVPDTPADDPNTEILRVNDGGTEVSGNAVDIVTQIVENEIGSTFAPEAIKAQAVTAYTYVKYHNLHGNAPYVLLKESRNSSVRTLVESVIGEAIYYEGELIQAVYSASSAGSTASSQNVWGGYIPYLQGVYCELDELYDPNYGRKKTFTEAEMKQRIFENAGISLSGDPSTWFVIENRTEGKYVGDMMIGGQTYFIDKDGDTLRANGRRFREIIMDYDIRSSAFDIEYNASTAEFTITTYGYGHGVGLSQNGANNLAKYWGWDYKRILTFYFTGTEVY